MITKDGKEFVITALRCQSIWIPARDALWIHSNKPCTAIRNNNCCDNEITWESFGYISYD